MHMARSQDTGSNLHLRDKELYADQIKARKSDYSNFSSSDIKVGDTVTPISPQDKHKVRDIYLVTGKNDDKVSAQRLLHPLSDTPLKFMSRDYTIHPKHLLRIRHPQFPNQDHWLSYYDKSEELD